jgi:hypothetical protein
MWEPQHLTTLQAYMAFYRNNFNLFFSSLLLAIIMKYLYSAHIVPHSQPQMPLLTCNSWLTWLIEIEVTLPLMAGQSVSLGVEPTLELVTRYYFLSEGCYLKVAI